MANNSYIVPQSCLNFPMEALQQGYFKYIPWIQAAALNSKLSSIQIIKAESASVQFKKSGDQLMMIIPMEQAFECREPFLLFLSHSTNSETLDVYGVPAALEDWYWEKGLLHIYLGAPEKVRKIKASKYHFEFLSTSIPKIKNSLKISFVAKFEHQYILEVIDGKFLKSIYWRGKKLLHTALNAKFIQIHIPAYLDKGEAKLQLENLSGYLSESNLTLELT